MPWKFRRMSETGLPLMLKKGGILSNLVMTEMRWYVRMELSSGKGKVFPGSSGHLGTPELSHSGDGCFEINNKRYLMK